MGTLREAWDTFFNVDTWENVLSGIGKKGRDRRRESEICVDIVDEVTAREMVRADFLARACVNKIPETCFREGYVVKTQDKQLTEDIHDRLTELEATPNFVRLTKFDRNFGGGGIFPVINDGSRDLSQPLNESNVMSLSAMHVFEPRELIVQSMYDDIRQPKYRQPKTFMLRPVGLIGTAISGEIIHESRLVMMFGERPSNDLTIAERQGYGDNALTIAKQNLADFGIAWGSLSAMLDQFSQGVLSLDGLAEMMSQDQGKLVQRRLQLMDQVKSVLRTLVISGKDKFERTNVSFAGIPDVMRIGMYLIAACLGIPVALLFGMSASGLNSTGDLDIRAFYDECHNIRRSRYQHKLQQLVRLVLLSKDGPTGGKLPEQWSIEWNPLWQMSDKEREDARYVRTQSDQILIETSQATADEIRSQRFGGDSYSYELQLTGPAPRPEVPPEQVAALQAKLAPNARPALQRRALIKQALQEPDDNTPALEDPKEAA